MFSFEMFFFGLRFDVCRDLRVLRMPSEVRRLLVNQRALQQLRQVIIPMITLYLIDFCATDRRLSTKEYLE